MIIKVTSQSDRPQTLNAFLLSPVLSALAAKTIMHYKLFFLCTVHIHWRLFIMPNTKDIFLLLLWNYFWCFNINNLFHSILVGFCCSSSPISLQAPLFGPVLSLWCLRLSHERTWSLIGKLSWLSQLITSFVISVMQDGQRSAQWSQVAPREPHWVKQAPDSHPCFRLISAVPAWTPV